MAKKTIAIDVQYKGKEAQEGAEDLKSSIDGVRSSSQKASKEMQAGFNASKESAKAATQGVKGFGRGLKALASATGILFILTEAFELLKELLMGNQAVADALSKAFKTVEIVFNGVFNAATDLINTFREMSSFSIKDIIAAFTDFGSAVKRSGEEAVSTANKLVNLRNEVKLAEAQQQKLLLEYQKEAEVQRQIRDDISLTIEERQAANDRLGQILDEQAERELALANKRLELAQLELSTNKNSIDAKVEVINAEKEIVDIQERITGQRSEQLTNANALIKENTELLKAQKEAVEAEAQAEADAAFKIAEAKIAAQNKLEAYLAERQNLSREEQIQAEIDAALEVEEAKFLAAVAAAQEQGVLMEEIDNLENARLEEGLRIENEIRAKYNKQATEIEKNSAKERVDISTSETEARVNLAMNLANGISSIVTGLAGESKAAVAIQKTLAVAQIAIDTARSISAAISGATQAAAATGVASIATTPVFIATQIATVLAAVGQAVAVLNSAGGGGNATVPSASFSPSSAASVPNFDPVTTNTTDLGNTQQAELAPVQAYVVETEITGNQENVGQIEGQAEFGG